MSFLCRRLFKLFNKLPSLRDLQSYSVNLNSRYTYRLLSGSMHEEYHPLFNMVGTSLLEERAVLIQVSSPIFQTSHRRLFAEPLDDDILGAPSPHSSRRGSSLLQRRKYSFPAALPGSLLGVEGGGMGSARRRLSNVSDAVTRKLSNTIGWRMHQVPCQEIIQIGRSLCSQYIRSRLKRSGFLNKKCGLQRLRSAVSLPGGMVFREVFPELLGLGCELERLHPKLYCNVTRQASSIPGGRLTSDKDAGSILTAVSREILKQDITWSKVVSLYAVAGGLAVDCIRQGHYDYLTSIVEAMEEILEDELAHWIQDKGGWSALSVLVRPPNAAWPWQ